MSFNHITKGLYVKVPRLKKGFVELGLDCFKLTPFFEDIYYVDFGKEMNLSKIDKKILTVEVEDERDDEKDDEKDDERLIEVLCISANKIFAGHYFEGDPFTYSLKYTC